MKIAIVEDEREYALVLKKKVEECLNGPYEITMYHRSHEYLEDIMNGYAYHLVLMDIELDKETGIDLAKKTSEVSPYTQIIYISQYLEYVSRVYETEHLYFIRKEELDMYLSPAMQKACEKIKHFSNQSLIFSWNKIQYKLSLKDILYFERNLRVTHIMTNERTYYTSEKLDKLIHRVSDEFVSSHKSYLVNLRYVKDIKKDAVVLSDDTVLPMSRSQSENFKKKYNRFLVKC